MNIITICESNSILYSEIYADSVKKACRWRLKWHEKGVWWWGFDEAILLRLITKHFFSAEIKILKSVKNLKLQINTMTRESWELPKLLFFKAQIDRDEITKSNRLLQYMCVIFRRERPNVCELSMIYSDMEDVERSSHYYYYYYCVSWALNCSSCVPLRSKKKLLWRIQKYLLD